MKAHLKTPFVIIPLFLNVIFLMGIPFFNGLPVMTPVAALLFLGVTGPWMMYFVVWVIVDAAAKNSARKRAQGEDVDFV
jgi:uncharacterized membrane protein